MMKFPKLLSWIVNLVFFFIGSLVILVLAYRFGWFLLKGPIVWGNDFPSAFSFIAYIDRWWPNIPRWYYEWTGGMPLLRNYPFLMTLLTVYTEHLTNLSAVQVSRFFFWFSMPLAGIGIMIFTRLITKNWLVAILAGTFSLLSPDPWLWIMQGGFYAVVSSYPFMVFTLVFFELACQKEKRLFWILTILFYGLAWTTHPTAGVATGIVLLIFGLVRGIVTKRVLSGLFKTVTVCLVGFLLMAFWTLPFALSRPGELGFTAPQIPFIPISELLGLVGPSDKVYITSGFFSGAIYFLAILGLILALFRRSWQLLAVIICTLVGITIIIGPGYIPWILKGPLVIFWGMINARATIIVRIFLPILAAFGAVTLGEAVFLLIERIAKELKNNLYWQILTKIFGGAITLIFVIFVFQKIVIIPPNISGTYVYLGYGPVYGGFGIQNINNEWKVNKGKNIAFPSLTESLKGLINFQVDDADITMGLPKASFQEIIDEENLTDNDRIDIFNGSTTASWNTVSGIAQTNPYIGVSLITPMFGYEQACLHSLLKTCNASEIKSLTKWWGLKLFFVGGLDSLMIRPENLVALNKAGYKEKIIDNHVVYEVPDPAGLATISNKPLILVIGDNPPFSDGFRTAFFAFNRSLWNYDKAMLIIGKRFIDDYSLSDLKKFPIVVLYGYQAHNKQKAWSMISDYVTQGGNLFVDTGWQYWSQDWGKTDANGQGQKIKLPDLLPVSDSTWQTIGEKWQDLTINKQMLGEDLTVENWADLTWENKPWGLALANNNSLKGGSFPLLTNGDKIVVAARNLGQGKVVWSGMNLFGHTAYYPNEPENAFLSAIFSWLLPNNNPAEENLTFKRRTPDDVIINIDKTLSGNQSVMFKEVAASGWQVFWQTNNSNTELEILRAGPGWKLVQLPLNNGSGTIRMTYGRTSRDWFYILISVTTATLLAIFLLDEICGGKIFKALKISQIKEYFIRRKITAKKNWEDEEK